MDWLAYLIGALIAGFLLINLFPLIRARLVRGRPVPRLNAVLTDGQRRMPRLLVYFWSPTCGICRSMTPVLDRLAGESGQIIKIDITENPEIAREFGVMATPSLAVVEQGVIRRLDVGGRNEPQIRALLQG